MREIRFRGKCIEDCELKGQWLYGHCLKSASHFIAVDQGLVDGHFKLYQVDPKTVGQFTGLKDKNGKEIYEGDVLQRKSSFTGKIHYQQVKWDQENARYLATSKQLQENLAGALERGYEWAGTIYEHPHLPKGDENA